MIIATLGSVLVFAITTFGFGAALAPVNGTPIYRLTAGIVTALGIVFGGGWLGFVLGATNHATALTTAVFVGATIAARARSAATLLAEREVRALLGGWLVLAGWALGLLALVKSYSGGGWAGDWLEHWQRTVFFLERQPLDTVFGHLYSLTARPPLANLTLALWLEGCGKTFAHYQVFMTLFGTLVLLPAWSLMRRWSSAPEAGWWLVLVLMTSPLVAQNLTFAWTKIPTAFFVLAGIDAVLRFLDADGKRRELTLAALCFGLGLLTHYSAGPWLIAVMLGWWVSRLAWKKKSVWQESGWFVAIVLGVFAPWFSWAALHFGTTNTVADNTTAAGWREQSGIAHVTVPAKNLFATLVPFPLRGEPADGLISQQSGLGRLRDVAFSFYQINLPLAFGLGGIFVLAWQNRRRRKLADSATARFFWVLIPAGTVLGVAVHTTKDAWGLAHICLQPLVLLGLAWIAAQLASSPGAIRRIWAGLTVIDVSLGIVLHYAVQSGALASLGAMIEKLNVTAQLTAKAKIYFRLEFFADRVSAPPALVAVLLVSLLGLIIVRLAHPERARG